jgi:hypothetical protein
MRALIDREIDALIRETDRDCFGTDNTTRLQEAFQSVGSYNRGRGVSPVRVRVAGAARPRRKKLKVRVAIRAPLHKVGSIRSTLRKVAPSRPAQTGYRTRPGRSRSF